ncbi:MAG: hypothetical protein JXQ65_03910 [Candidatus Marinimicrobia bacterium]|nr:hypothetical protein [Candidatus Neomarinimicrobiota bacterium]
MDFIVNNIESTSNVRMTKPSVEKNVSADRPVVTPEKQKKENDQVILSNTSKNSQEVIRKTQKKLEESAEDKKLSPKEIQAFQEKIKENLYNLEKVQDKIVYSLMTLPAFQNVKITNYKQKTEKESDSLEIRKELDELKKIQEELDHGGKMDEILEEAIDYLMHSLIS